MQSLHDILDAFDEPAFIVDRAGRVLFANQAARLAGLTCPTAPASDDELHRVVRTARVVLDDERVEVIVAKPLHLAAAGAPLPWVLPPWLARVARPLLLGLSDKEIAQALDMSLSTVRTCVARILRRVGVHSRGELIARAAELRREG